MTVGVSGWHSISRRQVPNSDTIGGNVFRLSPLYGTNLKYGRFPTLAQKKCPRCFPLRVLSPPSRAAPRSPPARQELFAKNLAILLTGLRGTGRPAEFVKCGVTVFEFLNLITRLTKRLQANGSALDWRRFDSNGMRGARKLRANAPLEIEKPIQFAIWKERP